MATALSDLYGKGQFEPFDRIILTEDYRPSDRDEFMCPEHRAYFLRKLKAWTGRVWIVALSGEEGAAPLGVQRREREAREIERIRDHPEVKQVLQHFPDARIAAVRAVKSEDPPAEIEDAEAEFKEDGTDP